MASMSKFNSRWVTRTLACHAQLTQFYFVAFFGVGRVNLEGTIPTELANLSSLKTIGVERNRLEGTIPSEFGLLTSLSEYTCVVKWSNVLSRIES